MGIYREPVRLDFWQLARSASGGYIDPWAGLDCQTHSFARAIMRHYEGIRPAGISGQWPPTGGFIRSVTRNSDGTLDRSGGTTLAQMAAVGSRYYGFNLDVRYGLDWATFLSEVQRTRGASISVGYAPIANSPYAGQTNFFGNHQMFVESVTSTTARVIDPLAGPNSRTGIYHGPGDYPLSLIKQAAGQLVLNSAGTRLGFGKVYVGFTQVTGSAPGTVTPPADPAAWAHVVSVVASPTLTVRSSWSTTAQAVGSLAPGASITATLLKSSGAPYVVNGVTHHDWIGFRYNGATAWVAAGWTRLVK